MILPRPPGHYTPRTEMERNRQLEQSDLANHKRGQDVEIGEARLILTSPNGTRFEVYVADDGSILSAVVP